MFGVLRSLYRRIDDHVLSRLSEDTQFRLKRTLYAAGRAAFPARVQSLPEREHLVRRRPVRLTLPDWALPEMEGLAREVDPTLHPEHFMAHAPHTYLVPYERALAGRIYSELRAKIAGPVGAIVFVPWIKQGGADLGVLHYALALSREFGLRTLVIATEPSASPWATRLPENVQFLEAGEALNRLRHIEPDAYAVLARLLVQLAPTMIHIVGSRHAWEMVVHHGQAISQRTSIFASLFCDEYDRLGCRDGSAVRYLALAQAWLSGVLTDNTASPREWQATLGVPGDLFHVVPFPAPVAPVERTPAPAPHRLLWAGRLDRQKRPDLLERLARMTPQFQWDVHGASIVPGQGADVAGLTSLPNVTLHGGYERFADIVRDDHIALVYTSQWDGLPNVLLEAAASQLPIIAPDIGGISDFIDADRLVAPFDDVDQYVGRIHELSGSPGMRADWVARQNAAVEPRDWAGFIAALEAIEGYGHVRAVDARSTEG
ncbi:MAG TPA: glycosyltransferase family 4 protein [Lysobacter sp.]